MAKQGTGEWWFREIQFFIEPHPTLHPEGEKVYVPRGDVRLRFWFDGGLQVDGGRGVLDLNFNDPTLFVLAVHGPDGDRIFRVPWPRLIALELIPARGSPDGFRRVFLN